MVKEAIKYDRVGRVTGTTHIFLFGLIGMVSSNISLLDISFALRRSLFDAIFKPHKIGLRGLLSDGGD